MPPNQRLFTNVSPANAGIYFATITNYGGAITSREALLTVLPPITSLGSWWQGGEDVYVTNGLAFLAQGSVGLSILSVSNPAAPMMLGGINTPGYANSVVVANGIAYVADGSSGLQIINVTNPSAPFLMGNCKHGGYATDLAVHSNLVFIAAEAAGLIVVDASNPAAPLVISSNAVHFRPSNIAIDGNFAFLSSPYSQYCTGSNCWNGGLLVVDISNPGNPVEAGHHVTNNLGALCVRHQTVFAAADYRGVAIYSVTNPSQPAWIGSFPLEAASTNNFLSTVSARDIQVIQDLVYVAGWSFGFDSSYQLELFVLDVRSLADPAPVGSYSVAGIGNALFADGNRVYATGTDGTFRIIETPFNLNPVTVPALTLSAPPGMQLGISGRRGFPYDLEFSAAPGGVPWQVFQTLLLTNDTTSIPVTPSSGAGFFRLKQLD